MNTIINWFNTPFTSNDQVVMIIIMFLFVIWAIFSNHSNSTIVEDDEKFLK